VFHPVPKVESALVRIDRRPIPAVGPEVDREWLFRLVAAGFGQRRKMLRRSLVALVEPGAFAAAGIRPEARAEELSVQDWGRLAACTSNGPRPS
jgi:16S rRNA (adenine1518-N6/adenine1519-N6)-dimethyltransferase